MEGSRSQGPGRTTGASPAPEDDNSLASADTELDSSPGETATRTRTRTGTLTSRRGGAPGSPRFASGVHISDRYRVVRFIAEGGMGEVYEVEDLALRERVALKAIRTEIAARAEVVERFRREIQLARKVTHGNVCRIFDVGFHDVGGPDATIFFTMELLSGPTLAERIRTEGRLGLAQARPILEQIASALDAAHAAGVVHRDLKPENVMLVGSRAVVTDFGLARESLVGAGAIAITRSGGMLGSPGYMAPEQVESGVVGAPADLYAFGVLMFEMSTGELPFVAETPLATAVKRLRERPRLPRALAPDIDPRWETAILRCLEREAADRFATAAEALAAIDGAPVSRRRGSAGRRRRLLAVGAAGVALVAAAFGVRLSRSGGRLASGSLARRRAIAIVGFKNASGRADSAWIATALAEMLATELSTGDRLRALPEETLTRLRQDFGLHDTDGLAAATLRRVHDQIGADLVLSGSYVAVGDRIRVDVGVQDTETGDTVARRSETGRAEELIDLGARAGRSLREALGAAPPAGGAPASTRPTLPGGADAARLYSEGIARLHAYDMLAARDLLTQAVALDPSFAMAHSALAQALLALGYEPAGIDEARRAMELAGGLAPADRLAVEGRYYEASGQWKRAQEAYRSLWSAAPDVASYGMALARTEILGGQEREALATLEQLRRGHLAPVDDALASRFEASAWEALGETRRQQVSAARAYAIAQAAGMRALAGDARLLEGNAWNVLGDQARAGEAYEDAKSLYVATGQRHGLANALANQGRMKYVRGDLAGARSLTEQALAILRDLGERRALARQLNNLSGMVSDQGDYAAAKPMLAQAIALRREVGDQRGLVSSLDNMGTMLMYEGDLNGANVYFQEALAIAHELALPGEVSAVQVSISGIAEAQDHTAQARSWLEQALTGANEVGDTQGAAQARLALAALAIDDNRAADALTLCGEARADFAREPLPDGQALERAIAALAYALAHREPEARAAAAEAEGALPHMGSREVHADAAILLARARMELGELAPARKVLEEVLAETGRLGLHHFELRARLALAQLELRAGAGAAARARLVALAQTAERMGYARIARQARAAQTLRSK